MDTIEVAAQPWAFTQQHPLKTGDVVRELARRRVRVNAAVLAELYRRRDLQPFLRLTDDPRTQPRTVADHPRTAVSVVHAVRHALHHGGVEDPARVRVHANLRFDGPRRSDSRRWWNGLLYSRWQLLDVARLKVRVAAGTWDRGASSAAFVLPELTAAARAQADDDRRWVSLLTAIDSRYLPLVDGSFLHLAGVDRDEWQDFADSFDPAAILDAFNLTGGDVAARMETLLLRARHEDPNGKWSPLISRAPARAWEALTGSTLVAHENRIAADLLQRLHRDICGDGPQQRPPRLLRDKHHLDETLAASRQQPLDELLTDLGVSPHPGVVLAVEGETEDILARRVREHLGIPTGYDHIHILRMGGADKRLALLAAAMATPVLGERRGDNYPAIRPPTRLFVAVDPDLRWNKPEKVEFERGLLLKAIADVIEAQGAKLDREELDELVKVRTWSACCFEFAHFTDDEIADALQETTSEGAAAPREELIASVAAVRASERDVGRVWKDNATWRREPSKLDLAAALWPVLRHKIDAARHDASVPMPEIAEVVWTAHEYAQESTLGKFVYTAVDT